MNLFSIITVDFYWSFEQKRVWCIPCIVQVMFRFARTTIEHHASVLYVFYMHAVPAQNAMMLTDFIVEDVLAYFGDIIPDLVHLNGAYVLRD